MNPRHTPLEWKTTDRIVHRFSHECSEVSFTRAVHTSKTDTDTESGETDANAACANTALILCERL